MKYACIAVVLLFLSPLRTASADQAALEQLLAGVERPEGVVFEIIAWQVDTWNWAAPLLRGHIERLLARFPGLDMALVSHGAELFDLARRAGLQDDAALLELARLSGEGLEIHVCGEYAAWKRLGQEDFLDFVDVADSGSAQLSAYLELGFAHIRLEPPHAAD